MSDYMMGVLNASKEVTFAALATICITAPAIGLIVGNKVVNSLDGYEGKNTFPVHVIICWVGMAFGLLVPFLNNIAAVIILLWLQLATGSVVYSNFTGVLITLV